MQHISVECLVCQTVSVTNQTELHLTIPLEVQMTIKDFLREYMQETMIEDYNCRVQANFTMCP